MRHARVMAVSREADQSKCHLDWSGLARWRPSITAKILAGTIMEKRRTPLPSSGNGGDGSWNWGRQTRAVSREAGESIAGGRQRARFRLKRRGSFQGKPCGCRRPRLSWRGRLPKQVSTCTGLVGGCMGRMILALHLDTAHQFLIRDRDGINGGQVVRSLNSRASDSTALWLVRPGIRFCERVAGTWKRERLR
jgi:hypothetical protein